jgi:hypothetical protein
MKESWSLIAWFGAGAVSVQVEESVLSPLWEALWFKLGILVPVVHWLASVGGNTLVRCWFVIWFHVPTWFLVALVGLIGGVFIKRHIVLDLMLFGLGFAFWRLVFSIYVYGYSLSEVVQNLQNFMNIIMNIIFLGIILGLPVLCGLLSHRFARRNAKIEHHLVA